MWMKEEPFGPIEHLTRFSDTDDVIKRANSLPFGLSSYVFTNSLQTATKASNGIEAGMVNINHFGRSEEHTSELQSLMRISYAVFCLKKKTITIYITKKQISYYKSHNKNQYLKL